MSQRTCVIAYLLTCLLAACAGSDDAGEQPALMRSGLDAESAAEGMLRTSLIIHSAVSSAFGRAKGELESQPFLFCDEINRALKQGISSNDKLFDGAADELLEQMQMTEEGLLTAKVYALIRRFAELISLPRESIPVDRLGPWMNDATYRKAELHAILTSDSAARKETAYYLAPAYNVVVSTLIFSFAVADYKRSTTELAYLDAIETNQHLIGNGEADDPGYLSDWVAAQTPGPESAQVKVEKNPIMHSLKRMLEEQQHARE